MKYFLFLLPLAFLTSCGSSTSIVGSWKGDSVESKDLEKVMVLAITEKPGNRRLVESHLVDAFAREGINAVSSFVVFENDILVEKPSVELLKQKLQALGIDAALTIALVDVREETYYRPGTTTYAPMGYGYYGGFYGYYGARIGYAYDPGYYSESTNFFLESNLYELERPEGQHLVWSAQTKTVDPSSFENFAKSYAYSITKQLKKDEVIN